MRLNSPHINTITKACLKASRSLIRDFGEIENLQVLSKGPGDFVTSADKRTEKILIDELQKSHPEYGIVAEEKGIINKSNKKNRWIIDPIDGTRSFVIGNPTWSNLISLNYKGYPVLGLANFQILKKYYFNTSPRVAFVGENKKRKKMKKNEKNNKKNKKNKKKNKKNKKKNEKNNKNKNKKIFFYFT